MKECVFKRDRYCAILRQKKCKLCPFRKTAEELEAGRRKAKERLRTLPKPLQEYIDAKYHKRREDDDDDEG